MAKKKRVVAEATEKKDKNVANKSGSIAAESAIEAVEMAKESLLEIVE